MFKKIFIDLCNKKGVAPTKACTDNGLSNAAFSKWTDESVPRRATLQRMADYFGVSVDLLLGKTEQKEKSTAEAVDNDTDMQLLEEAERIMNALSPARQEEAMRYLRYLASQSHQNQGKDMP